MNTFQIGITADMIMEKYYFLKVEELQLCFRRAIFGEYGTTYDRLDPMTIGIWLEKFMIERDNASDVLRTEFVQNNNVYSIFQSEPGVENPLIKILGDVDRQIASRRKTPESKQNETKPRQNPEKLFFDWLIQKWDERLKKSGYLPPNVTVTIQCYGTMMDFEAFAKYKFEQRLIMMDWMRSGRHAHYDAINNQISRES